MQRAAIAIPFAFAMLTASAVAPDRPSANVVHENVVQAEDAATAADQAADTSSMTEIVPEVSPGQELEDVEMPPVRRVSTEEICATLAATAAAHELPLPFFLRLIWQESRFRTDAVSRAGARGIAQFMPGTASERGLTDPHDPIQSLHKSAGFLRELRAQFGNLGLAAAAYNGGPGRVQAWLNGRKTLPSETRQYVHIVTGVPADQWRDGQNAEVAAARRIPAKVPCPVLLAVAPSEEPISVVEPARAATAAMLRAAKSNRDKSNSDRSNGANWSVVIAGSYSRNQAESQSARLQRRFGAVLNGRELRIVSARVAGRGKSRISQVSIPENDRASAERLCARLRAGGASCAVMRAS